MTIKEIAELCGVDDRTVLRWSKDVNKGQNVGSLQNLDEEIRQGKAADLSVETAAAIIRAGGREALAFLLEENAVTKNALAKITERIDKLEAQQEKFEGYAVAAYKKLEARVEHAYEEVRDNAAEKAADHVREYLLTSHKPSAHEAQLAELKRFLSTTIAVTGDRRDKIDFFRLWGPYETARSNPIPKDAFAAHVILLHPQIKFRTYPGISPG